MGALQQQKLKSGHLSCKSYESLVSMKSANMQVNFDSLKFVKEDEDFDFGISAIPTAFETLA